MENDAVEYPAHYNTGDVEAIDAARAMCTPEEFKAHCRLTAFKYIFRAPSKGKYDQDLRKAQWYLSWALGEDPRTYRREAEDGIS